MSFDTDWDVEKYKTEHESEEHWALRRSFMLAHNDKFPEERLVCLAQVFFNIEFLGCRYPLETMKQVAELSKGIADKFREEKQGKLQRTFVQASDAAGAKVKGLKRPAQESACANEPPPSSSSDTKASRLRKPSRFSPAAQTGILGAKPTEPIITSGYPLQTTFIPVSYLGTKLAQVTFGPPVFPSGNSSGHNNAFTRISTPKYYRPQYGGVKTYHIDQKKPSRPGTESNNHRTFGKTVLIKP